MTAAGGRRSSTWSRKSGQALTGAALPFTTDAHGVAGPRSDVPSSYMCWRQGRCLAHHSAINLLGTERPNRSWFHSVITIRSNRQTFFYHLLTMFVEYQQFIVLVSLIFRAIILKIDRDSHRPTESISNGILLPLRWKPCQESDTLAVSR